MTENIDKQYYYTEICTTKVLLNVTQYKIER